MRLVKLTVSGFKSFADRTEFTFDQSITGIVGPNGCGKSNVVDAVKWVLGERSSKSLRGKEMLDVIFAGSVGRKPSGLASVSLTFENPIINPEAELVELDLAGNAEDDDDPQHVQTTPIAMRRRILPIDSDIVEVERRLYRDGGSEYLINNKRARLRDIRDLFLDTGVGADAYSIIEQGKVDAMLLASPQERRTIFEEAAGIAKYKQRRIESQRKLDRAQANLALTREQLESTERRLRLVRGQATKARRFKELDAEFNALRLAVAFDVYDDLRQRLDGLTSRLADLDVQRHAAMESVQQAEAAKQEAEIARHEAMNAHKQIQEELLATEHAHNSALQRRQMTARALDDARRQADTDAQRIVEVDQHLESLGRAVAEQSEAVAALSERLAEAERALARAAETRAAVLESLGDLQRDVAQKRAAASSIDRERSSLLAHLQAEGKRIESLAEQLNRLESKAVAAGAEHDSVASASLDVSRAADSRAARVAEIESALKAQDQAAQALSADRRDLATRVSELEQRSLRLDGRRATLREMVDSREGFADAVKDVLERKATGLGFATVIAPLAELVETDVAHAAAVEAALGQLLQGLVIESVVAAPSSEELASLRGRVTFLPLSALPVPEPALLDLASLEPRVTRLRDVIAPSREIPMIGNLLDRLLATTYLVPSIDAAMLLATGPFSSVPTVRFVTLDGTIVEPDGRITAGPVAAVAEGLLQRQTELTAIEAQAATVAVELDAERASLHGLDAEVAAHAARRNELAASHANESRHLVADRARFERLNADAERLSRERKSLEEEIAQIRARDARARQEKDELSAKAEALARLHTEQTEAAEAAEREAARVRLSADASSEQLTSAKVDAGRLSEQLGSARREVSRLSLERDNAERQHRNLLQHLEQARARIGEHEQSIADADRQIAESSSHAISMRKEADAANELITRVNATVQEHAGELAEARQRLGVFERDWNSLEISRRELEVKRENLEERTQEDLAIDLGREYPEYRQMMSEGDVRRIDQPESIAAIEILRQEIKKLGNVNLDAIDEETQLEGQNENLVRQVADLDLASQRLSELIERLNLVSKEQFGAIFSAIQEHFGSQDGMFRRLFGGGRAEVRLMPLIKEINGEKVVTDEIDLLESGIEVVAKPPGKEPRTIDQLSGGEKTLTAVALLMSIFRSKPSCFCVLDEVDAALDEGNVARYCAMIRQFTDRSRFIVITHNKKTMQAADQLYGVTMQERGVSTRVKVRFDQVGAHGELPMPAEHADTQKATVGVKRGRGTLKAALASMRENTEQEAVVAEEPHMARDVP
ncbi:MAG: chromosome segregation protein SMC [Phycisphaeraceae bacterium]|nr:chromosome segregation protein SMC [Phycisphaeraceae bacterium]